MKKLFLVIICLGMATLSYAVPDRTMSLTSVTSNTSILAATENANNSEISTDFNNHTHTDITSLGTVTTGTWAATVVGTAYGGTNTSDGTIRASAGSASAPSIGFSGDTDTGLYSVAGQLYFGVDATGEILLQSDGLHPVTTATGAGLGKSGALYIDVWAANGTIQTSVSRTKTDIRDIDNSLKVPRGITYKRAEGYKDKKNPDKVYMGFLADDLPPEAFADSESVYTSAVIGILCNKVIYLENKIDDLEKRLEVLENK